MRKMCIKLDGRGDGQWTVQYSFVIEFQCFIKLNISLLWDLMHMWKVLESIRDGISAKFITNDVVLCRPVRMGTSPPLCSSWRRWWRTMVSTSAARQPTSSSLTWPWRTGGGSRSIVSIPVSAANRLVGEVVQSRRRPLLGPSPGWKRLLALSHLRHY